MWHEKKVWLAPRQRQDSSHLDNIIINVILIDKRSALMYNDSIGLKACETLYLRRNMSW